MNIVSDKWALTSTLCFAAIVSAACAEPLPTRKECIVELQLVWLGKTEVADRETAINAIAHAFSRAPTTWGPSYASSVAVPRNSREAIYVQFHKNCKMRRKMAAQIVSRIPRELVELPEIKVSTSMVEPSIKTIDVRGPSWADR